MAAAAALHAAAAAHLAGGGHHAPLVGCDAKVVGWAHHGLQLHVAVSIVADSGTHARLDVCRPAQRSAGSNG